MGLNFLPEIDLSRCLGCGICVAVCPNHVLSVADGVPKVAHPEACDYTGACQEICPSGAISLAFEIVPGGDK